MPLKGAGDMALFVADANVTTITELTRHEYLFDLDGTAGLEFRVTLSWIDKPTSTYSAIQLSHDLDLAVVSPRGTRYVMWSSGETDTVNNNERVIVSAGKVETDPGTWTVWVWAKRLTEDYQPYSLVVTGAISPGTRSGASASETPAPASKTTSGGLSTTPAPAPVISADAGDPTLAPAGDDEAGGASATSSPTGSMRAEEVSSAWSTAKPGVMGSLMFCVVGSVFIALGA